MRNVFKRFTDSPKANTPPSTPLKTVHALSAVVRGEQADESSQSITITLQDGSVVFYVVPVTVAFSDIPETQ